VLNRFVAMIHLHLLRSWSTDCMIFATTLAPRS